jgi:hypothetical protein
MKIKFVLKENIPCVNTHEFDHQLSKMATNGENNLVSLKRTGGFLSIFEMEVSRMTIELFFLLQTNATVHHVDDIGFPKPVKSEPEKMYNYIITGVQHRFIKEVIQTITKDDSDLVISVKYANGHMELKYLGPWLSDLLIGQLFESEAKVKTVPHDFTTELDNAMTAWDCRIHSSTKGKTRSGMWKKKKGLSKLAEEITDAQVNKQVEFYNAFQITSFGEVLSFAEALRNVHFGNLTTPPVEDSAELFREWMDNTISPTFLELTPKDSGRVFEKWIADKIKETYNELTPKDSGKVFEKWIAHKISEMGGEPPYLKWGKFDEAQKIKDDMAKEERVKEQRRARRKSLVDKQAKLIDWVCSMAPDHDFTNSGWVIYMVEDRYTHGYNEDEGDIGSVTFPIEIVNVVCEKLNSGELSF